MNIVITGCNGFIGRCLVNRLPPHYRLVALCSRPFPMPSHLGLRSLPTPLEELTKEDVDNFFGGSPFAIVHLAWHSPRINDFGVAARHVQKMAQLLEVTNGNVTHFVSLGSADEYGNQEGELNPQTSSRGPLSPYGWSKKSGRELLANHTARSGTAGFWLRPFTVYGEQQHGTMLLPYAVAEAKARRDAYFSDGLQQRDFIHVDDVVEAILRALASPLKGFQTLNLGWGKPVEIRKVLMSVARKLDAVELFHFGAVERRPDEPSVRFANIADAEEILQWKPHVTLEEGINRMVAADASAPHAPAPISSNS